MLMLMADVEFLDSLQTCFVNYDLYLPSALESLIDHHTHYCQVNNLRMTEQVGWEHIGLDVTGSRYDANPALNWGSVSIVIAISEVILRSIHLWRNDVFNFIFQQVLDHLYKRNSQCQLYNTLMKYAKYVEYYDAVNLIEYFLGSLFKTTDSSKQWNEVWG